jgi:hypothetical protein
MIPRYGFGCNIVRPQSPIGKVFGYFDSLTRGTYTDAGVTLTGKGGVVNANAAEAGMNYEAVSYPSECLALQGSCGCCN